MSNFNIFTLYTLTLIHFRLNCDTVTHLSPLLSLMVCWLAMMRSARMGVTVKPFRARLMDGCTRSAQGAFPYAFHSFRNPATSPGTPIAAGPAQSLVTKLKVKRGRNHNDSATVKWILNEIAALTSLPVYQSDVIEIKSFCGKWLYNSTHTVNSFGRFMPIFLVDNCMDFSLFCSLYCH